MIGIIAAISAAFSWTVACFIWRTQTRYFSAIQLNLLKNIIATLLFSPVIVSINWFVEGKLIAILIVSGLIGIALGDSFYISALRILGTRKTLTVEAFSPIIANLFGTLLIGEALPIKVWIGASIVTLSLFFIAKQKLSINHIREELNTSIRNGYIYAFLSVFCAVLAATLSRVVLKSSDISPLQATEIRLLGSLIFLLPVVRISPSHLYHDISNKNKLSILCATLLGTNLGILLQLTVFKYLPIGLGWTLLSVSPVISLVFARLEDDYIDNKSILLAFGTLLGVAIALL